VDPRCAGPGEVNDTPPPIYLDAYTEKGAADLLPVPAAAGTSYPLRAEREAMRQWRMLSPTRYAGPGEVTGVVSLKLRYGNTNSPSGVTAMPRGLFAASIR
jgi:hypothetical protein